jgi:hypothetical protein
MNKKDYIANVFRKILKEDLEEKAESLMNKLNYDETLKLNKDKEFDYVQEGETCEQCGGEIKEGENCEQCGAKGEVMELGGMDDGHPRFGKMKFKSPMTDDDIEKLLRGDEDDEEDYEEFDFSEYDDDDDYEDLDLETDWTELEEKFYGKQGKLDKNKNGRLDSEDFRMMGKNKTKKQDSEIDENFLKRIFGKKKEEETPIEEPKSEKTQEEPVYRGGYDMITGMRRDYMDREEEEHRKRQEKFKNRKPENNQPREKSEKEKEYEKEFERLNREYGAEAATLGIDPREVEAMHARSKRNDVEEQLYEVEFEKEIEEGETEEGNAFTGALAKAKKEGDDDFEVDGKKYNVKESILYTESDLIDLIEKIVIEEKNNIKVSEPKGYVEYERAHKADKKENEDYLKSVAKKMTDYLKNSSDKFSKYEMKETQKFPTENGGMKAKRKKYTPSDAVDEYIEAFSYPGQTNLVYDEIKPNDKSIEGQLKGSSTNGNAQVDKDGKALGNVVPSEVGERFYKNFKDNLYGQEQQSASYKRQPQPVDQAGENTERGSLKSKRGKKTSQSVLNKLEESKNIKKENHLNEEFNRIQQLMGYNRKTQ